MLQRMNITIPKELYDKIREVAFKEDISMSSFIQTALATHFEQLKTPKEDKSAIREVQEVYSCDIWRLAQGQECGDRGLYSFVVEETADNPVVWYGTKKNPLLLCKRHFDQMGGVLTE